MGEPRPAKLSDTLNIVAAVGTRRTHLGPKA